MNNTLFRLVSERKGDHVHDRIFVGPDRDHLALAGTLVFRVGEWQEFGAALRIGSQTVPVNIEFVGDDKVVE